MGREWQGCRGEALANWFGVRGAKKQEVLLSPPISLPHRSSPGRGCCWENCPPSTCTCLAWPRVLLTKPPPLPQ